MRLFLLFGCLAVLAAAAFGPPARAQDTLQQGMQQQTVQPLPQAQTRPPPQPGDMNEDHRERRAMREQRLQLRMEHEEIEAQRDRLVVACMDAKGQDRAICEQNKQALRDRLEDWHRRHKALEEKAEAIYPPHRHQPAAEAPAAPPPP